MSLLIKKKEEEYNDVDVERDKYITVGDISILLCFQVFFFVSLKRNSDQTNHTALLTFKIGTKHDSINKCNWKIGYFRCRHPYSIILFQII